MFYSQTSKYNEKIVMIWLCSIASSNISQSRRYKYKINKTKKDEFKEHWGPKIS